jgi:hypothetical protein
MDNLDWVVEGSVYKYSISEFPSRLCRGTYEITISTILLLVSMQLERLFP